MGVVYLIAGGGPRSEPSKVIPHHRALLDELGIRSPRIAYVGAASNDSAVCAAMFAEQVFARDARVVNVKLSRQGVATSTVRAELADADVIFLSVGDVGRGMDLINSRDLGPYLCELASQGKPMEGVSAGAIMLGKHWVNFSGDSDAFARPFSCIGVVPASFDTHSDYDGWPELRALARLLTESGQREVFGIADRGCARWADGQLAARGKPLVRFQCAVSPERLPDVTFASLETD